MSYQDNNNSGRNVVGIITNCVDPSCKGWLVDSFLGKYWIKCADSKHEDNNQNPTPYHTDRPDTTPEVNP